jgi:chromosomal replication initiator protein
VHSVNWPPLPKAIARPILSATAKVFHCLGPVQTIAWEEAEKAGITYAQILGAQRSAVYVRPRHIAMWRASRETKANLSEIGRVFGRDHTTVLYAIGKVNAQMKAHHVQTK